MTVDVFASARSLGDRRAGMVRVGHLFRAALQSGTVSFSLPLDGAARAALRRHGRLVLTVAVLVRSPAGTDASAGRTVVIRA